MLEQQWQTFCSAMSNIFSPLTGNVFFGAL